MAITDGSSVLDALMIVVSGDTNGDGEVSITDMLAVKAQILNKANLSGAYTEAADTNGDSRY